MRVDAVDDEERIAEMVARTLTQAGHVVRTAYSGEAALLLLVESPCDLLISDLGMGDGVNGWELAAIVRRRWPRTRIIVVTGWGASIEPEEVSMRGVDAVLAKPFRLSEPRASVDAMGAVESA